MKNLHIYQKALSEQKNNGDPIFLVDVTFSESQFFGNSKTPKKTFFTVKKLVASGTVETMKNCERLKLSCLVAVYGKKDGFKKFKASGDKITIEDETKEVINEEKGVKELIIKHEAIEIISFHGYCNKYENK